MCKIPRWNTPSILTPSAHAPKTHCLSLIHPLIQHTLISIVLGAGGKIMNKETWFLASELIQGQLESRMRQGYGRGERAHSV